MAVSYAVEGESGGSKTLKEDEHMPIHMVGGYLTVQAKLGTVDELCVVDTGSMLTFVTQEFYEKKLQPTCYLHIFLLPNPCCLGVVDICFLHTNPATVKTLQFIHLFPVGRSCICRQ